MAARASNRVSVTIAAVDRITAPIRRINRRIDSMTAPIRAVTRRFAALRREAGFDKLAAGAGRVARRVAQIAAVGGAAAAGIFYATKRTAEAGDQMAKLSDRIGFAIRDYQSLRFAADRSGVSQSIFNASVDAFSKRLGEARAGTGGLYNILRRTDPALLRQLQTTEDNAEAFRLLLSAISKLPTAAQRSAVAAAAFSRSGLPLVNLANNGAEGIAKLERRFDELGGALSEAEARAGEEFVDAMTDVRTAIGGVVQRVTVELVPVIQAIASEITGWIVANRELIRTNVSGFVSATVSALKTFYGIVKAILPPVLAFVEQIGGLRTVAIIIGGIIAATLIPPIVALAAAFGTTAGAITLAVTATAAGISALVSHWDELKAAALGAIDAIVSKARGLASAIPAGVRRFFGFGEDAGGGIQVSAAPRAARAAAARPSQPPPAGAPGAARAEVGGTLRIQVDQRGRVAAAEIEGAGDVGLELDAGPTLAPAL